MRAQSCHVACVEKIHSVSKYSIFNSLMMRQVELVRQGWFLDVLFQSRPTRESILSRDCELRGTEAQLSVEDFIVRSPEESRMKLPEPLGYSRIAGSVPLE